MRARRATRPRPWARCLSRCHPGVGVDRSRIGQRVWCYGAQSYRAFGTAAEYVAVPDALAVALPPGGTIRSGAGRAGRLPGDRRHHRLPGRFRRRARPWSACPRARRNRAQARELGAQHVIVTDEPDAAPHIRAIAPNGVDRVAEVEFASHIDLDADVFAIGGVICSYYSAGDHPEIPYWKLGFANTTLRLLGSDDFPPDVKADAAIQLTNALADGSLRSTIAERVPLREIARAHELVEQGARGRVIVEIA